LANRNLKSWRPKKIPEAMLKKQLKMNMIPAPIEILMEIYTSEYEKFLLNEVDKLIISTNQLYTAFTAWGHSKGFKNKIDERTKIEKLIPIKYIKIDFKSARGINISKADLLTKLREYLKDPKFYVEGFDDDKE